MEKLYKEKLNKEKQFGQTLQKGGRKHTNPPTENLRYLLTLNLVRPQIPLRPSGKLLLAPFWPFGH